MDRSTSPLLCNRNRSGDIGRFIDNFSDETDCGRESLPRESVFFLFSSRETKTLGLFRGRTRAFFIEAVEWLPL